MQSVPGFSLNSKLLLTVRYFQKIRELEEIDRKRSEELSTLKLCGKKEQSKERDREGENTS